MKIAVDVSPLSDNKKISHRVRGTGFYIDCLRKSYLKYFPEHRYTFFKKKEEIPLDVDVVHYPYFEPFFLSLPYKKNCRNIVTVHDLTPLVFPKYFPVGIKGLIKWQIQKHNLSRMSAIIADSISSKKDIIKYSGVPEKKIHVVYLAAGEEFKKTKDTILKQKIKQKYNLPDKFVLYVGDATWNKNLIRLIEAVEAVNVVLVMVGKALVDENIDVNNPWNQDLVKVQVLAKKNKKIIRLGFIPTEDLVILYNLATVFAMPSFYEGFGLPVLEAMQSGCPVVTSNRGSIAEVCGDAAVYVDPQDINSIANGLKKILEDRKQQELLSLKGMQQAKKFSWKKTAQQTLKVYEKDF